MPVQLPADRPALMAIVNVTPDSFSDGGFFDDRDRACDFAFRMIDAGADLVDIGGESTRPGAEPVPCDLELKRVLPVVEILAQQGVVVSVDTRKPAVAREVLKAGAAIINDVSGLRDPEMLAICANGNATVCVMHMQGTPETMQLNPSYSNVVAEVKAFLVQQASAAEEAGIPRESIWIDPGFGFGKSTAHNLSLLRHIDEFTKPGYPVLIGVSRKGFLGRVVGSEDKPLPLLERLEATLAAQAAAQLSGARIIRAHDVKAARRTIDFLAAVQQAS